MESHENTHPAVGSRLPKPNTTLGKFSVPPGRPLLGEVSASDNNARAMPPPPSSTMAKHRIPNLPEPQAKRKTLKERAGEPIRPNLAAPTSSLPPNGSARISSLSGSRNPSLTSSTTSRAPSAASSRSGSVLSFSQSTGPGVRPASIQGHYRSQSSLSHSRSVSHGHFLNSNRPPTSLGKPLGNREETVQERRDVFDPEERLKAVESKFNTFNDQMGKILPEVSGLKGQIGNLQSKVNELEVVKADLSKTNDKLREDLEVGKVKISDYEYSLEMSRRNHGFELDDLKRQHRNDLEDLKHQHRRDFDKLQRESQEEADRLRRAAREEADRLLGAHRTELSELDKKHKSQLEEERALRARDIQELRTQWDLQRQNTDIDNQQRERDVEKLRTELNHKMAETERANLLNSSLKDKLAEQSAAVMTLDSANSAMKAKIDFLESDNQAQSQAFADLHKQMQEAKEAAALAYEKLRAEETLRRKLHNQVQELKGNIRVFCRVRPTLENEAETARIGFPDEGADSKEVAVQGPEQRSALGNVTTATNSFSFDRVFGPSLRNAEIFEEISQLVQSALDGYNVCIFCYGQTGSGKTFTMSSDDGMIPRAVHQIYSTARALEEKGWSYTMEGSFVEVYNENLNDLLGKAEEFDKKKHEIRHDPVRKITTITDVVTVTLDSSDRVHEILKKAANNRSVAATKANQRSSRSHSVFILKLRGENSVTGERSEGTLNLVDLAGSERLSHSQATGDRLKETQSINRSLSCLGDVIGALGQGKEGGHVPYRNSKLTYLLQFSLGGNSKTLMFVMISPLQAHLGETLTSLKFATKVHNTHIGTAKRQSRVRD